MADNPKATERTKTNIVPNTPTAIETPWTFSQPGGSFGHGANPLALHGALWDSGSPVNPFNDGASGVDTVGSLIRTAGSGNTVTGTFDNFGALNGFWVEIQIVDPDIKLDFINVTLQFTNGTTESNPV